MGELNEYPLIGQKGRSEREVNVDILGEQINIHKNIEIQQVMKIFGGTTMAEKKTPMKSKLSTVEKATPPSKRKTPSTGFRTNTNQTSKRKKTQQRVKKIDVQMDPVEYENLEYVEGNEENEEENLQKTQKKSRKISNLISKEKPFKESTGRRGNTGKCRNGKKSKEGYYNQELWDDCIDLLAKHDYYSYFVGIEVPPVKQYEEDGKYIFELEKFNIITRGRHLCFGIAEPPNPFKEKEKTGHGKKNEGTPIWKTVTFPQKTSFLGKVRSIEKIKCMMDKKNPKEADIMIETQAYLNSTDLKAAQDSQLWGEDNPIAQLGRFTAGLYKEEVIFVPKSSPKNSSGTLPLLKWELSVRDFIDQSTDIRQTFFKSSVTTCKQERSLNYFMIFYYPCLIFEMQTRNLTVRYLLQDRDKPTRMFIRNLPHTFSSEEAISQSAIKQQEAGGIDHIVHIGHIGHIEPVSVSVSVSVSESVGNEESGGIYVVLPVPKDPKVSETTRREPQERFKPGNITKVYRGDILSKSQVVPTKPVENRTYDIPQETLPLQQLSIIDVLQANDMEDGIIQNMATRKVMEIVRDVQPEEDDDQEEGNQNEILEDVDTQEDPEFIHGDHNEFDYMETREVVFDLQKGV